MGLPTDRSATFAASDPVLSTILNLLQDCIAGDLHGDRPIVLGPGAWQPKLGGRGAGLAAAIMGDSQWVYSGAGNSILVADVPSPVGHEITSVQWLYTRDIGGGAAGTVRRAIYTRVATGAAEVAALGPTDDAASAAWVGATDAVSITRLANQAISLEVRIGNANHAFVGAVVTYRKLP